MDLCKVIVCHCFRISVGRGSVTKNIRGSFGGVVFRNKSALQSSPTNTSIRTPSNTSPDTLTITKNVSKSANNSNGWSRCHICNKKFLTPENLKQHMTLHQGGKPFRCNFCNLRCVLSVLQIMWRYLRKKTFHLCDILHICF